MAPGGVEPPHADSKTAGQDGGNRPAKPNLSLDRLLRARLRASGRVLPQQEPTTLRVAYAASMENDEKRQ
jgi:hypothetical protein